MEYENNTPLCAHKTNEKEYEIAFIQSASTSPSKEELAYSTMNSNRKSILKEDPGTPLKYGKKAVDHYATMPAAPAMNEEIPMEARIFLSVFDNEPAGPFRPDGQRFQT